MRLCVFLIIILCQSTAFAWDNKATHMDLTGAAADISIIDKKLLDKEYSFEGETKTLRYWLEEGAKLEDSGSIVKPGTARYRNHFHNPLATMTPPIGALTDGGLTDAMTGQSAVIWAQDGSNQEKFDKGDWSWQKVRDHYYLSLTESDKSKIDEFTAKTYLGLGYQMHLLQDMGQPDHVRNDAHPIDGSGYLWGFETWARDRRPLIKQYATTATKPTVDLTQPFYDGYSPVARLMDTRGYKATITPSAAMSQGLAEYTNANFFSDDTIFAARFATNDKHYFPYPRKEGTDIQSYFNSTKTAETVISEDGKTVKGLWISKTGEGETVSHLVRVGPMAKLAYNVFGEGAFFYTALGRDEITYDDYAQQLIPRAVGYSAALLDYFFRGKIKLTPVTPEDITFRSIKVLAQNDTTGEDMGPGNVSLVIRYKTPAETSLGGGKFLLNKPPKGTGAVNYTYKVITLPDKKDLKSPTPLTFDLSNDPLPLNYAEMSMQLVYRGPLGKETDAVAVSPLTDIDSIYADFYLLLPKSGVFAKTSDNSPTATFDEIRMTALTAQPGGLSGGTFSLALTYLTAVADQFQSVEVKTYPVGGEGYYVVRKTVNNGVTTLEEGTPTELVFDLTSSPIPVSATDVRLNVVYTSNETSKVIAVGVQDISEPTPVDVFNNTDYTCLNSTWYRYDDPKAMTIVVNPDNPSTIKSDIYPKTVSDIAFQAGPAGATLIASPKDNNLFANVSVQPGQMLRLGYILTDYTNSYTYNETMTRMFDDDYWIRTPSLTTYSGTGFMNQGDIGYGMMATIKGNMMWWGTGIVYGNPAYSSDSTPSTCDWKDLPLQ